MSLAGHHEFWDWFTSSAARLAGSGGDEAVTEIESALAAVDDRLAAEVSGRGRTPRELIVTARGDRSAFPVARALVAAAPRLPGWAFVALKPPGGFDFSMRVGGITVRAADLRFDVLTVDDRPELIGIRLFVPPELARSADASWVAAMLVHTGIGEELASGIAYTDTAALGDEDGEAIPVTQLSDFLDWHRRQQSESRRDANDPGR